MSLSLKQVYEIMQQHDTGYASELYDHLKESVKLLCETENNYASKEKHTEEEEESYRRKYCIAYRQLKMDAEAYQKARGGKKHTDVGEARMIMCEEVLRALKQEWQPYEKVLPYTGVDYPWKKSADSNHLKEIAAIVEKEGELAAKKPFRLSAEKAEVFVKEHRHLHKMLEQADDESFLRNYAENRKILSTLIWIGTGTNDKTLKNLAWNAKMYERYFKNRITILKLPETCVAERVEAERELEILKDLGVKTHYQPHVKEMTLLKNDAKGDTLSTYGAVMEAKGTFSHPSKYHIAASGKIRGCKLGTKINTKWVRVSSSLSALKAAASTDDAVNGAFALNDINTATVSLAGSAQAYGAKARGKIAFGTKSTYAGFHGQVILGDAMAYAKGAAGMVKQEEGKDKSHQEYGLEGGAGAQASIATLVYGGEFSIFGFKIKLTNKVRVGAVGAHARGNFSTGHVGFSIGLALGLGGDLEMTVDWSSCINKFRKWRKHSKRIDREKKEAKIRKKLGEKTISQKQNTEDLDRALADPETLGLKSRYEFEVFRRILTTAKDALENLQKIQKDAAEWKPAADRAMAALVLVDLIRIQRQTKVGKDQSLENAIHGQEQLEKVLHRIIENNKDGKLWKTPEDGQISADSIRRASSRILKIEVKEKKKELNIIEKKFRPLPDEEPSVNGMYFGY